MGYIKRLDTSVENNNYDDVRRIILQYVKNRNHDSLPVSYIEDVVTIATRNRDIKMIELLTQSEPITYNWRHSHSQYNIYDYVLLEATS